MFLETLIEDLFWRWNPINQINYHSSTTLLNNIPSGFNFQIVIIYTLAMENRKNENTHADYEY